MAALRNLYTVNYFPVANSGYSMWTTANYNGTQYQADMTLAKNLGFNTMRVVLAALTGVFDYPTPTSPELAGWTDFYARSKTAGVKLHLTLFDQWSAYGKITGAETWIAAILGALPDFTNLACIEIQNETPYASAATYTQGFDAGWTVSQPSTIGPAATGWAQYVIPYIRTVAPGVPVVTSCTGGTADLQALFTAVHGTGPAPDWYEWHCYANSSFGASVLNICGRPAVAYRALQQVIAVVGDPALLAIGETGADTTPGGIGGSGKPYLPAQCGNAQALQFQLDYLQGVRWACQQLGLGEPAPWILYDLQPCTQFASGQTFGLYTTSGAAKPSAALYARVPPGASGIPGVGINGNMQGTPQADAEGNLLPPQWTLYRGQLAAQPIVAAVDYANPYKGNPSVLLTGSAATSGSDNSPALEIDSTPGWPLVTGQAGQSCTFSAAMKATGTYGASGYPKLQINWYEFGFSGDTYLSSVNGSTLTLTSSWQVFSLSGTIPASADYARLFVQAGYNAGSIWVAGATWAGAVPLIMNRGGWLRVKLQRQVTPRPGPQAAHRPPRHPLPRRPQVIRAVPGEPGGLGPAAAPLAGQGAASALPVTRPSPHEPPLGIPPTIVQRFVSGRLRTGINPLPLPSAGRLIPGPASRLVTGARSLVPTGALPSAARPEPCLPGLARILLRRPEGR